MRRYLVPFFRGLMIMGSIVLLIAILALFKSNWERSHFICSFPDYPRLSTGMTKTDVEGILGKPSKLIRAADETQSFYCSPGFQYYSQSAECWWYEFRGWSGRIEVYFDGEDRLIGKGCGTG